MIQNHSIYNDTTLEYKFNTGLIKHDLIAGVEVGTRQLYEPGLHAQQPAGRVDAQPGLSVSTRQA